MTQRGTAPRETVPSVDELIAQNLRDETLITDTGNAARFVEMYGELVRYAVDAQAWYAWCGTHWCQETPESLRVFALTQGVVRALREDALQIEDDASRARTLNVVALQESRRKRESMLAVAKSDPRVQTSTEALDAVMGQVVAPNGTIDLDTGKITPSHPDDMNSRCLGVAYDPRARSPLLDDYLKTFMPNEHEQRFVFAVLGHALRGGNPRRLLPIFWGETTSGKSQLFAGLDRVLGSYACAIGSSVFRGNLDDKPRPDLVMAMYTRVAYASEASRSWALHADQIKRLTGGDSLPYRNLYAGVVNAVPRFTPMLVTNVFPRITGADVPLKRRILTIHFDRSLPAQREDPTVKQRFLADDATLRALLARIVAGARDPVIAEVPERFALATMQARSDMDHTDEFLEWMREEEFLVTLDDSVPAYKCAKASELYACYRYWLHKVADKLDRADELGRKQFGQSLRDKGWESTVSAGVRWVHRGLGAGVPLEIRMF